jgi:peptide/nickel transport system ATP-binding protein
MLTMYAGQVVEDGPVRDILVRPAHPYTAGLLGSIPRSGRRKTALPSIPGRVPSAHEMPPGCRFAPRCTHVEPPCLGPQELVPNQDTRHVRCRRAGELALPGADA